VARQPVTGREPVTATGVGAAAGVVGADVVGGGVTVVGVAVGVSWQVQVGDGGGGGGVVVQLQVGCVVVGGGVVVGGDVDTVSFTVGWAGAADDASAEVANISVRPVAATVMLARPAILARFVIFKAVIRSLLSCGKIWRADSGAQADRSSCHRAVMSWCPTLGTPGRNVIERQAWY
jgi:hypothetical protein